MSLGHDTIGTILETTIIALHLHGDQIMDSCSANDSVALSKVQQMSANHAIKALYHAAVYGLQHGSSSCSASNFIHSFISIKSSGITFLLRRGLEGKHIIIYLGTYNLGDNFFLLLLYLLYSLAGSYDAFT